MKVHNHGPNQGRGLGCGENLLGHCMIEEIEQKAVIEYMKSKEVPTIIVKFDDEKVEAIAKAWVDAGPHPDYHRSCNVDLGLSGQHWPLPSTHSTCKGEMMAAITKLYGQFMYQGSFFSEEGATVELDNDRPSMATLEALNWDGKWFCVDVLQRSETRVTDDEGNTFTITTPGTISKLIRRIYVGDFYTLDQVAAEHGKDSILYHNLDQSDFVGGVKTRAGNWQPVNPEDIVLDKAGNVRYARA